MKRTSVTVDGLRILRDEGVAKLHEWDGGPVHVVEPVSAERAARLREAVREATDRLDAAQRKEG